jgi:uncharacterized protein (TIGR02246 family)
MARPLVWIGLAPFLLAPQLAFASDSTCSPTLSPADATAVRGVIDAYRTAWLRGDAKAVMDTLTADAVLLPAHGARPVVGADAIKKYWWPSGGPPTTITKLDITVEQVGGDCQIAYAHGRDDVAWTIQEGGTTKTFGHPGTYLNVFRRMSDGSWRISHHMWDDAVP